MCMYVYIYIYIYSFIYTHIRYTLYISVHFHNSSVISGFSKNGIPPTPCVDHHELSPIKLQFWGVHPSFRQNHSPTNGVWS